MKKYFRFEDIVRVNFQCFSPRKCSYVEGFNSSGFHVSFWGGNKFLLCCFFFLWIENKSSMTTTAWKNHLWAVEARNFSPDFHYLQAQVWFNLKACTYTCNVTVHICCMLIAMWNLVALLKVTHRSISLQNFRFFGIKVCIHDNNSGFKESKLLQRTVPGA